MKGKTVVRLDGLFVLIICANSFCAVEQSLFARAQGKCERKAQLAELTVSQNAPLGCAMKVQVQSTSCQTDPFTKNLTWGVQVHERTVFCVMPA